MSSAAGSEQFDRMSSGEGVANGVGAGEGPQHDGVIDVLGALACGEMSAFERMASDARMAPTMSDKAALAGMAVAEFQHFRSLCDRLREFGIEPESAMQPFVVPLNTFHDLTAPADWLESLVKAYVGDGIARDFYREVAAYMDPRSRDLVREVLADMGQAAFAVDRVRAAIDANPAVGGRLALWARRLVGEALTQAQRVAVDREAIVRLLSTQAADLAELGRLFERIIEAHNERMRSLGLSG
ncbi:MAG TPA: ferritin-like fold-containing protein [Frankiaceae bacterium]|nr:ferritin-like fold-containing protein [Frankiaceae bacterium]